MYRLYNKEKIEKCIEVGQIEIVPIAFMRGRNFTNCLVVADEAQNLTDSQTELLLTRMCSGSKLIFCGDSAQIDLRDKKTSGFELCVNILKMFMGLMLLAYKKTIDTKLSSQF